MKSTFVLISINFTCFSRFHVYQKTMINLCCTCLTRACKSTCPAEYCSITSFTSYGFKASLNFRLATRSCIRRIARITFLSDGVNSSNDLGCSDGESSSEIVPWNFHVIIIIENFQKKKVVEIIFFFKPINVWNIK